ncbi:BTB/POZ and TAZ domain-containing protein 3 [Citrus sinensis]|nr:BTB/POZ and TAZ domain-containing protein 3 [Citrus sinensis]
MASPDIESPWLCAAGESFCGSFNIRVEEGNAADILHVLEVPTSSVPYNCSIPKPPPLPIKPCTKNKYPNRFLHCSFVPKETKDVWDKLFKEGNGADVYIITKDESCIQAHSSILQSKAKNGFRYIKIPGMPHEAVYAFVRFLYSSCSLFRSSLWNWTVCASTYGFVIVAPLDFAELAYTMKITEQPDLYSFGVLHWK